MGYAVGYSSSWLQLYFFFCFLIFSFLKHFFFTVTQKHARCFIEKLVMKGSRNWQYEALGDRSNHLLVFPLSLHIYIPIFFYFGMRNIGPMEKMHTYGLISYGWLPCDFVLHFYWSMLRHVNLWHDGRVWKVFLVLISKRAFTPVLYSSWKCVERI